MSNLAGTLLGKIDLFPGKKRVLSNNAQIYFRDLNGGKILLGELDNFTFKNRDEIIIKKPAGFLHELVVGYKPGGWDLEFSGGKVDWKLMRYMVRQANITQFKDDGSEEPKLDTIKKTKMIPASLDIEYTVYHYGGTIEQWIFTDVRLFNFQGVVNGDMVEIVESMKGFAPKCVPGGQYFAIDEALGGATAALGSLLGASVPDPKRMPDYLIDQYYQNFLNF